MDGKRVKKWFMLQVWRLQQVAQIMTLALLALNLALQIFDLIKWRQGSPLSTSWIGVPMILLFLAMVIWSFAMYWDLRLKMWRDQATVLVERNPYSKEKLSAKEVMMFGLLWLPMMEKLSKDDPKLSSAVDVIKSWIKRVTDEDPNTARDVKEIFEHIGKDRMDLLELGKK